MDDEKKENIFLDAKVTVPLHSRAFRAELSNGHGIVAYVRGEIPREIRVGDVVRVCMSPFDMSVGRVVFEGVK